MKRTSFLGVSSKRSSRSSKNPFNFSFFSVTGWGIGLDYRDIEWFALETNRDLSVVFEIASEYCISDSFDHDGYSISSKGFLPTVVDTAQKHSREEQPHVQGAAAEQVQEG